MVVLVFGLLFYKANSIYQEAWDKEPLQAIDWNLYSNDFKIVALSEYDQDKTYLAFSRITLNKYLNNKYIRPLEWQFLGHITFLYSKFFVDKAEALPHIFKYSYLGPNIIGFSDAAKYYFTKGLKDLDLSDSALIFAISIGPNRYNPLINIENAYKGRSIVLERLRKKGVSADVIKKAAMQSIYLTSHKR